MITYEQAMDFINTIPYIGQRDGVNRVRPLLHLLGDPQQKLKTVHIAGTNGKGSTAAMTASVLRDAGLKTGLFISPYVEDFRERIQLDGRWISKEELAAEADILIPLFRQLQAQGQAVTEFEFDTAMALHYFVEQGCDAAVLEAGMGGRLDATNAIPAPAVCALTSISYDHTKYLGDTLDQIAAAKCGILKQGARAAVYPKQAPEAMETILAACREKGIAPNIPDLSKLEILSCNELGAEIRYQGRPLTIPLRRAGAGGLACELAKRQPGNRPGQLWRPAGDCGPPPAVHDRRRPQPRRGGQPVPGAGYHLSGQKIDGGYGDAGGQGLSLWPGPAGPAGGPVYRRHAGLRTPGSARPGGRPAGGGILRPGGSCGRPGPGRRPGPGPGRP